MHYRITGLPESQFTHLFDLSEAGLAAHQSRSMVVDRPYAFPCRVSLTDAQPGERVVLTPYTHHAVDTPFRSTYAIYVRPGETRYDAIDEMPDMLRRRVLSLRAFDASGMMVGCELADGQQAEPVIRDLLSRSTTAYVHAHFAKAGCFAAAIVRG
jgi:hypothetical protein